MPSAVEPLAAVLALLAGVAGCDSDSTATRRQIENRVRTASTQAVDAKVAAMRPMYGLWTVDLDATLAQNPSLSEAERDAVRRDLTTSPFELEITSRDYISRSPGKTIADRYVVERVDIDIVTIALTTADGAKVREGRRSTLRLQGDKLLIGRSGTFVCVFSRSPAGPG